MPIPVETPVAELVERLLKFAMPLSRIKRGNRNSLADRTNDVAIIDGKPITFTKRRGISHTLVGS